MRSPAAAAVWQSLPLVPPFPHRSRHLSSHVSVISVPMHSCADPFLNRTGKRRPTRGTFSLSLSPDTTDFQSRLRNESSTLFLFEVCMMWIELSS